MGISERKEREKLEMRELILKAATAMFIEEGYEKTSLRNIAEKIEYSPATIYLYFKDKDELFFAIHQLGFEKLLHKMMPVVAIENPLERLRELGRIYIDFGLTHPEYYDLMFIMRAPINALKEMNGDDGCWQDGDNTMKFLESILQECIDKGLTRSTDKETLSMYTWATVHGMVSLHIRERYSILEIDEQEIKARMLATVDLMVENIKK